MNFLQNFVIKLSFKIAWEYSDPKKCGTSCLQCDPLNVTKCLKCDTSSNKELINNQCVCKDGFYNVFDEQCKINQIKQCSKTCKECDKQNLLFCTKCDSANYRVLLNKQCVCQDSYYQKLNEIQCIKCNSLCLTCESHSDKCIKCKPGFNLTSESTCVCPEKQFHNKLNDQCENCKQTTLCQICSSSDFCTKCINDTLVLISGVCKCPENANFHDDISKCQCKEGYILLNSTCVKCSPRCKSCKDSIDFCFGCDLFDEQLVEGKCNCREKKYEITNTDGSFKCENCLDTCKSCKDKNSCTTCYESGGFFLNEQKQCVCKEGQYIQLNFFDLICDNCDEKCQVCENSKENCTKCKTDLGLVLIEGGKCVCSDGYFYDTSEKKCKKCKYNCSVCNSLDKCTKCIDDNIYQLNFQTNKCECKDGYYIDEENKDLCVPCQDMCKTCSYYNKCTACKYETILNQQNECVCVKGEYFDKEGTKQCLKCLPQCKTCINGRTCSSCLNEQQYNYDSIQQKCFCKEGYFEKNMKCIDCTLPCSACQNEDICLKCIDDTMVIIENKCVCPFGSFYDNELKKCSKCSKRCKTCLNQNQCSECMDNDSMELDNQQKSCICKKQQGYFEDSNGQCKKCDYSCKECSNDTSCISCKYDKDTFIIQENGLCVCKEGLHFDKVTNQCQECLSGCKKCEEKLQCIECANQKTHVLDKASQQCVCAKGYFQDNNKICNECDSMCTECKDSKQFCTQCAYQTETRLNSQTGKCECLNQRQFFNMQQKQCQDCSLYCGLCDNSTTCIKCLDDIAYKYNTQTNLCQCAQNFFEDQDTKLCVECNPPNLIHQNKICVKKCPDDYVKFNNICITECPDSYVNINGVCTLSFCDPQLCKKCSENKIDCQNCLLGFHLMKNKSCQKCDEELEFYDSQNMQCEKCNESCKGCTGPTNKECLSCFFARNYDNLQECILFCKEKDFPFQINDEKVCKKCFDHDGECIQNKCQDRFYNSQSNICKKCHQSCLECNGHSKNNCIACDSNLTLENGRCLKCMVGYFENQKSQICEQCHYTCDECIGRGDNECLSCSFQLKLSKISNKCIKSEDILKEIEQKNHAKEIGCIYDDFQVCKEQIEFSKQTTHQLNTLSTVSVCFSSTAGMFLQSVSLNTWTYIQNHQIIGNLKSSSTVLPYGIIDNHLKVSEYFNVVTFFSNFSNKKKNKKDEELRPFEDDQNQNKEDKNKSQRILLEQQQDQRSSNINQKREYFLTKCILNLMIFILHFISPCSTIAMKIQSYIKWSLAIRIQMLLSNSILYASFQEIMLMSFNSTNSILNFVLAIFSIVQYLFLLCFSIRFLLFSNCFANGQLRTEFQVIYQGLNQNTKMSRMFWIFFEIKKIVIILIQLILHEQFELQLIIIISISFVFLLYIILIKPHNLLSVAISCIIVEVANIFFFTLLLLISYNPSKDYLSLIFIYSSVAFEGVVLFLALFQILLKILELTKIKKAEKLRQDQDADSSMIIGFKVDINIDSILNKQQSLQSPFRSPPRKLILKAKYIEMEKH